MEVVILLGAVGVFLLGMIVGTETTIQKIKREGIPIIEAGLEKDLAAERGRILQNLRANGWAVMPEDMEVTLDPMLSL